jgi:hypothetical protein
MESNKSLPQASGGIGGKIAGALSYFSRKNK